MRLKVRLAKFPYSFILAGYGVAFPKNSMWIPKFNEYLMRYRENGDLERMQRFWFTGACEPRKRRRTSSKPLALAQVIFSRHSYLLTAWYKWSMFDYIDYILFGTWIIILLSCSLCRPSCYWRWASAFLVSYYSVSMATFATYANIWLILGTQLGAISSA